MITLLNRSTEESKYYKRVQRLCKTPNGPISVLWTCMTELQ